jgi:hypothetical protein
VVEHAGHLDDAAELDLAPVASDVGRAEGGDEPAGLGASFSCELIRLRTCSVRCRSLLARLLELGDPRS